MKNRISYILFFILLFSKMDVFAIENKIKVANPPFTFSINTEYNDYISKNNTDGSSGPPVIISGLGMHLTIQGNNKNASKYTVTLKYVDNNNNIQSKPFHYDEWNTKDSTEDTPIAGLLDKIEKNLSVPMIDFKKDINLKVVLLCITQYDKNEPYTKTGYKEQPIIVINCSNLVLYDINFHYDCDSGGFNVTEANVSTKEYHAQIILPKLNKEEVKFVNNIENFCKALGVNYTFKEIDLVNNYKIDKNDKIRLSAMAIKSISAHTLNAFTSTEASYLLIGADKVNNLLTRKIGVKDIFGKISKVQGALGLGISTVSFFNNVTKDLDSIIYDEVFKALLFENTKEGVLVAQPGTPIKEFNDLRSSLINTSDEIDNYWNINNMNNSYSLAKAKVEKNGGKIISLEAQKKLFFIRNWLAAGIANNILVKKQLEYTGELIKFDKAYVSFFTGLPF